ncbi:hypothetical protein BaRGS_00040274, partial [Batillaria attramentaria]
MPSPNEASLEKRQWALQNKPGSAAHVGFECFIDAGYTKTCESFEFLQKPEKRRLHVVVKMESCISCTKTPCSTGPDQKDSPVQMDTEKPMFYNSKGCNVVNFNLHGSEMNTGNRCRRDRHDMTFTCDSRPKERVLQR